MPDRNIQKMPLRTWWSFTRATPRSLFGGIDLMAGTPLLIRHGSPFDRIPHEGNLSGRMQSPRKRPDVTFRNWSRSVEQATITVR
jgi:hypothetical protein